MKKLSVENSISISVAIIAIAALSVAVWEGLENRRHNRLSVYPRLEIYQKSYVDDPRKGVGIWLRNAGIGPAIVSSFTVFVDGKEMAQDHQLGGWQAAEVIGLAHPSTHFLHIVKGGALPIGYDKPLFWYAKDDSARATDFVRKILRIEVAIEYTSMYGEKFVARLERKVAGANN